MVLVRCEAVICGPATGTQPLDDVVLDHQVENPVDRYPVDRVSPVKNRVDIGSGEGATAAADHLQDLQAIGCSLQAG